jgi:homoserine dehydrogenase
MNRQNKLTIGLFGFGIVGEGIYHVLGETPSLNAEIRKICIKHPGKKRDADPALFTVSYDELLNDKNINLIVELINDADEAYKIVTEAMRKGKSVVSANKKMIAEHLEELLELQEQCKVSFLYEAAVCGSLPVIRNLEEYYDNDLLKSISGIVNGSTNFILTKIIEEKIIYSEALIKAQQLGFAETDPSLDVTGKDALNKLVILLLHAYGLKSSPGQVAHRGIDAICCDDVQLASEKDWKIKLIARAQKLNNGKIAAFVLPQFVNSESQLYNVKNEFNGVVIESKLADEQFLYGKGAGRYPTSSAVLSDIAALRYDYRYEYRKLHNDPAEGLSNDFFLRIYVSFEDWNEINKWDFETIEEFHSTEQRKWIIGLIHFETLKKSSWFYDEKISIIAMPDPVVEKREITVKQLKKLSLQMAGV